VIKRYKVKVIERHIDIVFVNADSEANAINKAINLADCTHECVDDARVLSVEPVTHIN